MNTTSINIKKEQSPRSLFWARFRSNRLALWSMRTLYVLIFLAIMGDFIANEKPLYCKLDGQSQFPIFHQYGVDFGLVDQTAAFLQMDWQTATYESVVFPLIPYSSTTTDIRNKLKSPFSKQKTSSWRYRHWLGTDRLGHDLFAGLIYGTRIAMMVGLISMSIAAFIGILLGAIAGYFGDDRLSMRISSILTYLIGLYFAWFFAFQARSYTIAEAGRQGALGTALIKSFFIFVGVLLLAKGMSTLFKKTGFLKKSIRIPLDIIIMRSIEVVNSIPGLLLLLALVAVLPKSSVLYVMMIIGFIRWPGIARFLRAELLRIRNLGYIESGRALGYSKWRILFYHALPNALTPVLITLAFGMASAILLESALSFLGIGIGEDGLTWGRLLSEARNYQSAWWLAIFPGIAIFITVTALNLIGEGLDEAMNGR